MFESNLERLLADPLVRLVMRADRVDAMELGAKLKAIARRLEDKERGFPIFASQAPRHTGARLASTIFCSKRSEPADRRDLRIGACGGG
jgi:hypothetical protein